MTRFVQPEKIEIDANERAVNEKSPYCFFVCTTFDSFLNDFPNSYYHYFRFLRTRQLFLNTISQLLQSKIHLCLTILSFITIFSHQVFILLGIPQTHFSIYAEVSVYTRARSTPVIPYRYFSNTAFFGCWNLAEDCAPQYLTFSINI